jgi:hypothetical protein
LRTVAFVVSAALAAATFLLAWDQPVVVSTLLAGALLIAGVQWFARRRLQRLLRSGDVASVLRRWSPSLERIPHPATMGPLMTATAFAAYGWVEKARAALASAERGPAWDAAIEHRLFLNALLLTFEGERDEAIEQAGRLARLPLPPIGPALRARVQILRLAVGALARAFAHQAVSGDADLLEHASRTSPLVFWAMRYGAAVVAVDRGDVAKVRGLLEEAPVWPVESAFRAFHDEIAQQIGAAPREAIGRP